ncbi:MAG: phosphatase PAP2 family protein [Burkholderiales bacterium]|nr:phosphatase PAP2 family protein [Burkholderiales bacterium]
MSDALVTNREGIVGTWQGKTLAPKWPANLDGVAALEKWEPWVRAATIDVDLLAALRFAVQAAASGGAGASRGSAHLAHVQPGASATAVAPTAIVSIVQPPQQTFEDQLHFLDDYADLREDRAVEIVAQLAPPVGFWGAIVNLHPTRTRWTNELIDTLLRFATSVEMRFKHALDCPRPLAYSPQVQPMILTPGHGSLPSGHATEAFAVARVLEALLPGGAAFRDQLQRQAARVAINRTVAGVHFPIDSAAGRLLGDTLAGYFLARCGVRDAAGNPLAFEARSFDGTKYPAPGGPDFDWREPLDNAADHHNLQTGTARVEAAPLLAWLWGMAAKEWQ